MGFQPQLRSTSTWRQVSLVPDLLTNPAHWQAATSGYSSPHPAPTAVPEGMKFSFNPSPTSIPDAAAFFGFNLAGLTIGNYYLLTVTAVAPRPSVDNVWHAAVRGQVSSVGMVPSGAPQTLVAMAEAEATNLWLGIEYDPAYYAGWGDSEPITVTSVKVEELRPPADWLFAVSPWIGDDSRDFPGVGVLTLAGTPTTAFTIERVDETGKVTKVRMKKGTTTDKRGFALVLDPEAQFGRVTYRLVVGGKIVATETVTFLGPVLGEEWTTLQGQRSGLISRVDSPYRWARPIVILDQDGRDWPYRQGINFPAGSSEPVVAADLQLRGNFTMTILCPDIEYERALRQVMREPVPLLLRTPCHRYIEDRVFFVTNLASRRLSSRTTVLVIQGQEVALDPDSDFWLPSDPPPRWTYADLEAQHTYQTNEDLLAVDSYFDLMYTVVL